jgi:alginate O-acetyltransferase complex protein AlgJ
MNFKYTSETVRSHWDALTIFLFLGLLWLPTLDHFFKLDHARMTNENRMPAQWPALGGLAQSREFIAGVENYFNDHFGFRKRLIRWNHHWKNQLFRTTTSRSDVLVGRDGWFFHAGERMLEHWTRQSVWTEQDLRDWRRLLEGRRDWLRKRGIKYLFVVPPDKHTVYPEHLPAWMEISSKPSKLQQLAEYMKTHSDVEFIDLSQSLIDAKQIRVTYLKTDTHWNAFGGFAAYQTLVRGLARQIPGLEPLGSDAYEWQPLPQPAGDVAKVSGKESIVETEALKPVPVKPVVPLTEIFDPVRFPHQGSKETRPCYTHNDNASGKALVFHDSFACTWYPLLGQHFKEVVYVWQYPWDWPLIEREKPDVVIDEILERFFNIQDPTELILK